MRQKNQAALAPLRMLKAALMNREVEKGRALDEAESLQVVNSLVKQRRDSIEQFKAGGRQDLADKEQAEIGLLQRYLPPAADEAAIASAIEAAVAETGAAGPEGHGQGHEGSDGQAGGLIRWTAGPSARPSKNAWPAEYGSKLFPAEPRLRLVKGTQSLSSILRAGASTAGVEAPSFFGYAGATRHP